MMRAVYLVSCASKKLQRAAPAKELYCSDWFRSARKIAEESGDWFILSAKHGLLSPNDVVRPYNKTLNSMSQSERMRWAASVQNAMDRHLSNYRRISIFAGERYREFLLPYLRSRFESVDVPMSGLKMGQQLQWLKGQAQ